MTRDELLASYLLARILWWRHDLQLMEAEAVAEVIRVLQAAQADIRRRLLAEAAGLAAITHWTRERLEQVNAWADEVLAGARGVTVTTITESVAVAGVAAVTAYNATLSFDGAARAVRTVGLTRAQVLSWFSTELGQGGLERYVATAFNDGVKAEILDALRRVGVEGKGTAEAVRRVMSAAVDAGAVVTKREATALTRTFIMAAENEARERVYAANQRLIKGYKRVETLDNKTCLICAAADGLKYGLDEPRPRLPAHPNCRGLYVPIAKTWEDWGFASGPEMEAVARPWTLRATGPLGTSGRKIEQHGQIAGDYRDWWASLSPADKAKTPIGPVRRKLLESGRLSWDDLVDKHSGRVRTLAELGYTRGGVPLGR